MTAEGREKTASGPATVRFIAGLGTAAVILALWPGTVSPAQDPKYLLIGMLPLFLGLAWLLQRRKDSSDEFVTGVPLGFLLGFLAFELAAALASRHLNYSLHSYAPFLAMGLICLVVAQVCRTPEQAWRVLLWIGAAVAVSSVYGLAQRLGLDPFPWATREVEEYRGLPATYGNPNVAAHTLNLGLLILLGLSTQRGRRWCLLLAIPVAMHLWMTEVRAARVAVPAGLCMAGLGYIFYRYAGQTRRSLGLVCVASVLIGGCAIAGAMAFSKVATGTLLPTGHTYLLRYNSYFGASQMIVDQPLLGFGPGTYRIENPPYWTPYEESFFATDSKYNANVHNEYLETGVESGFVGAFCYIGFLLSLILLGLHVAFVRNDRSRSVLGYTLAACFTAFAVDGMFGFNLRSPVSGLLLFVLAGALVGVSSTAPPRRSSGRRWTLPVTVCVAGFALAGLAVATFASQVLHQKATAATAWGYPDVAARFLRYAERLAPWDARIVRDAAAIDASQGRTRQAISGYQRALARNPYWVLDQVALARLYFQLDEVAGPEYWRNAEARANEALTICAVLPEAHEMLGRLTIAEALKGGAAESALEAAPAARIREGLGHLQKALTYGIQDRGQVHRMMAQAFFALGETDEAQDAFVRAAESSMDSDMTWTLFEGFASGTGRWEPYVKALNGALARVDQQNPSDCDRRSRLVWWLARAYATGLNDRGRAGRVLTSGVRACPESAGLWGAYVALSRGEHDRARLEAALTYLRRAIGEDRNPPDAVSSLLAYIENPEASAVEQVSAFLDAWPGYAREIAAEDRPRTYGWLFGVYGSELATAPQPAGERGPLLLRLGAVASSIGAWAQAEPIFASAFPLLGEDRTVECLLLRSDALEALGRMQEALRWARDASKQAPSDFRAQHAFARLLALNGNAAEARLAYRLLLTRFALDAEMRRMVEREMNALMGEEAL